jgi:DnaK suppressor protein
LTCNNSGLNTGTQIAPVGSRREDRKAKRSRRDARMGKADQRKTVKKAAPKPAPKAAISARTEGRPNDVHKNGALKRAKSGGGRQSSIVLPEGYQPSENEPFMNERHRLYFRNKLVAWKEEIIRQNRETLQVLHEDSAQHADLADRATSETDRALELRARDRQRKLIAKIDAALARIEDGTYGFCEETGEPIGLKRLDARPIATLSLEAQERHERREKVFRED